MPGSARPRARRVRRVQRVQRERLPLVLHGLARELRAGGTLHHAVQVVADDPSISGPGLRAAVDRVDAGTGVIDAVDRWAAELAHPDADLVRAVLNAGASTGGAMAASLDRAAGSLRERVELQREIRALSSQARMSAVVLTVAPLAFLFVMAMADRSVLTVIATSQAGRAAFAAGLVLDAIGWLWMRRLIDAVAR
jgi:tight adherence protein B